jgi:hypothetical protein
MRLGVWIGLGTALVVSLLVRPLGVIVAVVAIVAISAASGVILLKRVGRGDLAFGIVSVACRALPEGRGHWGEAMLAELDRISGRWQRLGFALGCARAALLPPPRPGAATQAVRIVVATTVVASIGLFLYTRSRLVGASYPGLNGQPGVFGTTAGLLFVAVGTASAVTALVRFPPARRRARASLVYGAVGGLVVGGVALAGSLPGLMVKDNNSIAPNNWFLLAALATTLAAGVAAARSSHDPRAGKEAGWWAGAIGGAILFIGLNTLSYTSMTWFAHDPVSIHAFHTYAPPADQTHYATIAAVVLDSHLKTGAFFGIFVLPALGFVLGALGGAASKIHDHTTNATAGRNAPRTAAGDL